MKHLVVALIASTFSLLVPQGALAATPAPTSQDATRPGVMQQAAEQVANAKPGPLAPFVAAPKVRSVGGGGGLRKEVFGFALASSLSDPTLGYPSWNFSLLSTVAVFGLHVNDNGNFTPDSGWNVWNSSQLSGLISKAHTSGTKVVATIILQDFSSGTPHMCAGLANRATTVTQTVAEVNLKGVDGVNVDYEGLQLSCANGVNPRAALTDLHRQLRAALPATRISVDTYASSAGDPVGFFDIAGLNAYVDSFFVMAYDSDRSNYGSPPLGCGRYCLSPVSPLTGYFYNDTRASAEYRAAVAASKVILGLPYYSRADCVSAWAPNQYPSNPGDSRYNFNLPYTQAVKIATDPTNTGYAPHRDQYDSTSPWSTWTSTGSPACPMEMYWDDVTSLAQKYDLVNRDDLGGVGLWNLNFGGGTPELWSLLMAKFGSTTPWYSLGGVLSSGSDASSWDANRSDVFVRGTDNGIYHSWWDGSAWRAWEPLGGVGTSDPTAVSWGSGHVDVFVRGSDNSLYHRAWNGTAWSGWESLGGILASGADVASWGPNRLDVFARGTDNALYHKFMIGTTWYAWESLGGSLAADPTAASWAANRIDVFSRLPDNSLGHKWWDGTAWRGWESLGGGLASSPDAASCSTGHLDVLAIGSDQAVYQLGFDGSWLAWRRLGGRWGSDLGAVCRPGTASIDLYERGSDAAAWRTVIPGT